jgi:hypothetical protein
MSRDTNDYQGLPLKLYIAAGLLSMIGAYLIFRNDKPRENFSYQKGEISYLSRIHPLRSSSEPRPKDIYLIIDGYDRVFELFIGEDKWDFSPRLNRMNELKIGDEVEIYFEENFLSQEEKVNRLLQYLDKGGELYYKRSSVDKNMGYFILGGCLSLLILGLYVKYNYNRKTQQSSRV